MTLDPAVRTQIEETLSQHRVVLFMKGNKTFPQCGFSATVVKILKDLRVPFETVNVLTEPALREGIKAYSEWSTIPQLYVDKQFVGGCDIVREMHESGQLRALLGVTAAPAVEASKAPSVTLSARALAAFREVGTEEGDVLRFAIGPRFDNELFFGPPEAGDVIASASGLALHLDPASAARADGVTIDFVESEGSAGFKIQNPNAPASIGRLSARKLAAMQKANEVFVLVDVRTLGEHQTARIAGARLLDEGFVAELEAGPKDQKLVFQCHHGVRSRAAAERFLERGFTNVWNLEGGIDAYSEVDPTVPRY